MTHGINNSNMTSDITQDLNDNDRIIITKLYNNDDRHDNDNTPTHTSVLPWIENLSLQSAALLKTYVIILKPAFFSSFPSRRIFSVLKHTTPFLKESSVVYNIPFTCSFQISVANKGRLLKERISSRRSGISRRSNSCAFGSHVTFDHSSHFDSVAVLGSERHAKKR